MAREGAVGQANTEVEAAMKTAKLSEQKQLRASTKGNITRIKNLVYKKGGSVDELECRLAILESYFKQAISIHSNIVRTCPPEDCDANENAMAEIEDIYVEAKAKIKERIGAERSDPSRDISSLNATTGVPQQSAMRRHIKLPTFEGKYCDFPKFMAIFNKMVHRDDSLDDCEKFLILKEHLSARALQAVDDFEITGSNYKKALERLQENFDKKNLMFDEHIAALFAMQKVVGAADLRKLIDSVNTNLSAMLSLGNYQDITNAMLIYLVVAKLDDESLKKWEDSVDYTALSTWETCASILSKRCENMEAREVKNERLSKKTGAKDNRNYSGSKKTTLALEKGSCEFCKKEGHNVESCRKFEALAVQQRRKAVRAFRLCYLCLQSGHRQNVCKAQRCSDCGGSHHRMLHELKDEGASEVKVAAAEKVASQQAVVHATSMEEVEKEILLATALVGIKGNYGTEIQARALLDSASQIYLMSEPLLKKLNLKWTSCLMTAHSIADSDTNITKKVQTTIKSRTSGFEVSLEFYVLPKITAVKPDHFMEADQWGIPHNIKLADPKFNKPGRVDLLLGAEIFWDLVSVGRIKLTEGLPRLQKTVLGWVVAGAADIPTTEGRPKFSLLTTSLTDSGSDATLTALVEQFWALEQINTKTSFLTPEEALCEETFTKNAKRDQSGRFVVKMPFKDNTIELGDSYSTALRRFKGLENRLRNNEKVKEMYVKFMEEYLQMGHMELVPKHECNKIKYYAPHTYVLRPESSSTKLRVVFDCSCKSSSGLSLNDVMYKGPVVQDDLLAIVLRFRCYKYGLSADVTKMYRQVWVSPEDSLYQCILWRKSKEEELQAYRLLTVTYGTAAAPYLATRVMKALGEEYVDKWPYGADKVLSDFYMDDLITGADTIDQIGNIYNEVSEILKSAGLELRKWYSNNVEFLKQIPEEDREKPLRINDAEIIKTLGLFWEPAADILRYDWPDMSSEKRVTKRIVLAEVSKLFDPLGLINPIIVKAKIYLQNLWILKVHWDESLPAELHAEWKQFKTKLPLVKDIRLPRYVLTAVLPTRIEIHGFCDASLRAYGACVYIRSINNNDEITVALWSGKSRVAPLKTKSLPRLELLAAELLAKLLAKVKANLVGQVDATYLWTDSEIVLDWLSVHPAEWTIFVANRVAIMQELTQHAIWRHVPTKCNPADIISRGAFADELLQSRWFVGPKFLYESYDQWPPNKVRHGGIKTPCERRKITSLLVEERQDSVLKWIEDHSSFVQLQRKVTFILHGVRRKMTRNGMEGEDNEPVLTATSLREALMRIMFCVQQHYFPVEIKALSKGEELPVSSPLRNLSVFLAESSGVPLIRVGGRLARANLPYDTKHPVVLPGKSPIVKAYIRHLHETNLHVGIQALIAILRQQFWVIHARRVVRLVTTKCLLCFRYKPKLMEQIMGQLPERRVAMMRPFATTGVDFCGPVLTTVKLRGARTLKSYLAVFVCFASKAVHIEVVSDLSSKAFIGALKRFVARRGLCEHIYCDNGTNFVGARRELQEWKLMFLEQQRQNKIHKLCAQKGIEWHHIPPRSPHFGGLWEAAVKSAKYHLNRILGDSRLTFEELSTLTAEIESILNSRPLCSISSDPNDEEVLTPAHLITGIVPDGLAEPIIEPSKVGLKDRWQRITQMKQHFWARWSKEYLHELQRRTKWTKKQNNLAVGDLVLIADDCTPPLHWMMGRVTQVMPDENGQVRVAEISTRKGRIKRAIQKLARIPINDLEG